MARVLVDTSALFALVDRNDKCHEAAKTALESLKMGRSEPLLTTFILAECHALFLSRIGVDLGSGKE